MFAIKIITLIVIIFIINYVLNKKKDILIKKKQRIVKINNGDRILNEKDILDIVYNIEGYYYYNQQAYIEMINYLEKFLEIIELCNIDPHYSTNLNANLLDLKKLILNTLLSFELKLPKEYNVHDVIKDMTEVLDGYLNDIYILHENYIKENNIDSSIKLIIPNALEGYNTDYNLFEPSKKLYFNRI